ncbi:unnamed protein product, partial [Discosporangium mesarthrocarpum]
GGGADDLLGWEAGALSRVGLKYVRSVGDLAWYLSSLQTLPRELWPAVIAVDDVDKIIEASSGTEGMMGPGRGGAGSLGAILRVFALLQASFPP